MAKFLELTIWSDKYIVIYTFFENKLLLKLLIINNY